jgi:hypothetical protein
MLTQILALIKTKQRDLNPYPILVLRTKAEGQRRDIVSCLAVFFWVRARIIGSVFINNDTWEDTLSNHQ